MYIVDRTALETAQRRAEEALNEYKTATRDRMTYLYRYKEANQAYLTLLRAAYNL